MSGAALARIRQLLRLLRLGRLRRLRLLVLLVPLSLLPGCAPQQVRLPAPDGRAALAMVPLEGCAKDSGLPFARRDTGARVTTGEASRIDYRLGVDGAVYRTLTIRGMTGLVATALPDYPAHATRADELWRCATQRMGEGASPAVGLPRAPTPS